MGMRQSGHGARHPGRAIAIARIAWLLVIKGGFGRQRRDRTIVERIGPALGRHIDQHKAVAPEVPGARQGDGQRKPRRHRRIDRIAAPGEYVGADPAGDVVLADDQTGGRDHRMVDRLIVQERLRLLLRLNARCEGQ
jgi:hypothetical protein